jgi:hypothetical protein
MLQWVRQERQASREPFSKPRQFASVTKVLEKAMMLLGPISRRLNMRKLTTALTASAMLIAGSLAWTAAATPLTSTLPPPLNYSPIEKVGCGGPGRCPTGLHWACGPYRCGCVACVAPYVVRPYVYRPYAYRALPRYRGRDIYFAPF